MQQVEHQEQFNSTPADLDTEDFTIPSFITLARIYDLLAVIALSLDAEGAEEVLDMHEQGLLKGALPSLRIGQ